METLVNLTSDISKSCAFRGGSLPKLNEVQVPMSYSKVSSITFSIHNATHIDLPWLIDWELIKNFISEIENKPYSSDMNQYQVRRIEEIKKYFNEIKIDKDYVESVIKELIHKKFEIEKQYFKWIEKDCVILDFSDKIKIIEKFLNKKGPTPTSYLNDNLSELEIMSLFNQLSITEKDIIAKIEQIKKNTKKNFFAHDLSDKIIIFKTLWTERFLPYKMDINNPLFEGWHVFLTYPYLTKNSVQYLIQANVAGIGSDTVSLENPFLYIDSLSDNYKEYLLKLENTNIEIFPLHLLFLSRKKIIIENLWHLKKVNSSIGKIYIFPYNLGTTDGTIANVFLKELK